MEKTLCSRTLAELAAGLKSREFSSAEIVRSALEAVRNRDGEVRAFLGVTPENALLCAILASALPRRDLAADPALFPWDWRNHLANRLVVRQTVDPDTGEAFWDGGSSGAPRLLATTQAVLALRLLAQ